MEINSKEAKLTGLEFRFPDRVRGTDKDILLIDLVDITAGGMRWLGLEVETFKTDKR